MANESAHSTDIRQSVKVIPYERNGLQGECVSALENLNLAALPWDGLPDGPRPATDPEEVQRVKRSRTRCVLSFPITGPGGAPVLVYAKRCRVRRVGRRVASIFRPGKCRREWEVGWQALRRGLFTPMPLLWAERRRAGVVTENYLVTLGVEKAVSFRHLWHSLPAVEARREWLSLLGRFIRRLHDKGFCHDDLNTKHVLLAAGGLADLAPPQFYVIDLDNARMVETVTPYRRAHNFFQIFRSLPESQVGPEERTAFLSAYSDGKWTAEDIRAVNRAVNLIGLLKKTSGILRLRSS